MFFIKNVLTLTHRVDYIIEVYRVLINRTIELLVIHIKLGSRILYLAKYYIIAMKEGKRNGI